MDFKKLKNKKGITLIALAVTIVVLLILAGVTISSVFSENGIIKKAQEAENAIEKAKYNDLSEIAKLEEQMEKYTSSNDTVGVDLSEYATLDFQAYVGRRMQQKCEYMGMFIEISNANDETDKITYNIGTDWESNIIKENDSNKLFLKNNSQLQMVKVDEHDISRKPCYNSSDVEIGTYMSTALLTRGFTDVKLNNVYLKKGTSYNIKIGMLTVTGSGENIVSKFIYVYNKNIENVNENIALVASQDDVTSELIKTFDFDGDGATTKTDSLLVTTGKDSFPKYYIQGLDGESYYAVFLLLDENGDFINEEAKKYIAYDIDRNGYIDKYDEEYVSNAYFYNKF